MILEGGRDGPPWRDPAMSLWAALLPTQVQLDSLVTTKRGY